MKGTKISLIAVLLVSIIVVIFGGLLLYRHFKRWALVRMERDAVLHVQDDIAEYEQLGFSQETELIKRLHAQLQWIKHKRLFENQGFSGETSVSQSRIKRAQLKALIALNKKMLKSYIKDMQEYRKLGVSNSHNIIRFSYDKIVRLTIALAELERQLDGGIPNSEYTKRVARMREITKQSIAQFKDELKKYCHNGVSEDQSKMQFVRAQLTRKVKELYQLNKVLQT